MNRKREVNINNHNKLLYDPNQRKLERLGAFSMQENLENNELDSIEENDELEQDLEENLENEDNAVSNENDLDNDSNFQKNVNNSSKEVAKQATKEVTKQASKAVGTAIKKVVGQVASKIGAFLIANPWVLIIIAVILVIFFIIIIIIGGEFNITETGYFDSECNYNEAVVVLTTCDTTETSELPLDKYVIGLTYSYIKDYDLTDETIKALLIILKTNALSDGEYDNIGKTLYLDDCDVGFEAVSEDDNVLYEDISELYLEVENYLYLSSSYTTTITELSSNDALFINNSIITKMEDLALLDNDYRDILNIIFNDENVNGDIDSYDNTEEDSISYELYDLASYCTFYNITENDAYWWPIGSLTPTSGNIYGGNPSTVYISSNYGPRTIKGENKFHYGIDIAGACEDNVIVATKDGTIIKVNDGCPSEGSYGSSCGGGYGNYVMIDHGDGTVSVYAHMFNQSIVVNEGSVVRQGEKIGLMGSSGSSTGCHLHFEIRINDSKVNPLDYVNPDEPRPISQKINISAGDEGGQQAVCQALLASGFSKNATAGIMVNINAESGFRTDAVEYSSGYNINNIYNVSASEAAGFGLFQWSFGRRVNMISYAKSNGMSPTSLKAQLEYFVKELNESYPVTNKYVTGNYSAYDIANNFCLDFERPANKNTTCSNRANNYVNKFIEYVNNGCR